MSRDTVWDYWQECTCCGNDTGWLFVKSLCEGVTIKQKDHICYACKTRALDAFEPEDDIHKVKGEYVNLSENHNLIFGMPSDVWEFECDSDVLNYKIRYRSKDFVWVALKFEDKVEQWYIGESCTEPPYWYPAIHIGTNKKTVKLRTSNDR